MENDEDLGLYSALINVHIRAESRQAALEQANALVDYILNSLPDYMADPETVRFSPFEMTEMIVPATPATA